MREIFLVRHGPTHVARMVGWTDHPADLSDVAAIARLSAYLPDAPIISSDLSRAIKTADAIQGSRDRLAHNPDLREFHYGDWENKAFDEIDSPELRRYFDEPGSHKAPNGESWDDVSQRVEQVIMDLKNHKRLIVVAHMGVILTQWARALDVSPYKALGQKISNLSVTHIKIAPNGQREAISANVIP